MDIVNPAALIFPLAVLIAGLILLAFIKRKTVAFSAVLWVLPGHSRSGAWMLGRRHWRWWLVLLGCVACAMGVVIIRRAGGSNAAKHFAVTASIRVFNNRRYFFIRTSVGFAFRGATIKVSSLPRQAMGEQAKAPAEKGAAKLAGKLNRELAGKLNGESSTEWSRDWTGAQLRRGVSFVLPANQIKQKIYLLHKGHTLWKADLRLNAMPPILDVRLASGMPAAVTRVLAAMPRVGFTPTRGAGRLRISFYDSGERSGGHGNQLLFAPAGAAAAVSRGRPLMLMPQAAVMAHVHFGRVMVRRMAMIKPGPSWRILASVHGKPWILEKASGFTHQWLIASLPQAAFTNWQKTDAYVIFMANVAAIARGSGRTQGFWLIPGHQPTPKNKTHGRIYTAIYLASLAVACFLAALWGPWRRGAGRHSGEHALQ